MLYLFKHLLGSFSVADNAGEKRMRGVRCFGSLAKTDGGRETYEQRSYEGSRAKDAGGSPRGAWGRASTPRKDVVWGGPMAGGLVAGGEERRGEVRMESWRTRCGGGSQECAGRWRRSRAS